MSDYARYLAALIPEKDSLKLVKTEAKQYYETHSLQEGADPTYETPSRPPSLPAAGAAPGPAGPGADAGGAADGP